ncbi:uncharacterized protein [Triticum aestivum]|uniref:uncharacterized protein isoform X2 n=1 Tax=Triticum aestivum TaxID=4565 RepID=UPI001D002A91|nr:uncharacterized protein LOC123176725 isoform X2 [Triticum aestivum]
MPPVTFVIVRHHARLDIPEVPGRCDMTDKSGDILLGTLADKSEFDFYLCNNAGTQGTSSSTHYHVLYDENNFTADALQSLTKKLCNTYARCVPGLSTVAPAFYAHVKARVCTRHYMEGDGSTGELNIKLLGGGDNPDTGRSRKRPREEESGSSSQSADHPTLGGNRISNISNAGRVPFVDYVKAHRGSFIVKVGVQDCTSTVVGRKEDRYDFADIGRVLGSSFLIAYFDTHKENLTWGGELMFEDIEVHSFQRGRIYHTLKAFLHLSRRANLEIIQNCYRTSGTPWFLCPH